MIISLEFHMQIFRIFTLATTLWLFIICIRHEKYRNTIKGRITGISFFPYGYNHGYPEEAMNESCSHCIYSGMNKAFLVFSYNVNGKNYRRATYYTSSTDRAEKMIGKTCKVYYDPEKPGDSSIIKNSTYRILTVLCACVFLLLTLIH